MGLFFFFDTLIPSIIPPTTPVATRLSSRQRGSASLLELAVSERLGVDAGAVVLKDPGGE